MFQGMKTRINSCGVTECAPSWSWDTGVHGFNDYDLWAVFGGSGEIEINGVKYEVKGGMCFILPPNSHIKGSHNPQNPLFTVNVHFTLISDDKAVFPYKLERRYIENQVFFRELLNRVILNYYRGEEKLAHKWLEVSLSEYFSSADYIQDSALSLVHNRIVQEMCVIINENVSSAPSLNDFAQKYGYSATYLGKTFHKIAGVGYAEYLLSARINQAKIMLKTTELNVADIANELGFCDTGFCVKQFKKAVGMPPGAFRKSQN